MNAPTTAAETAPLTPEQQKAQAIVDTSNYAAMLRDCLPSLRAEVYAAEYMLAETTGATDAQRRKKRFMKCIASSTGVLPPLSDCALRMIQAGRG